MQQLEVNQVRNFLKENKFSWNIPDAFKDTMIVQHPLGADPKKLIPSKEIANIDIKTLISKETGNPYLLERRKALNIITTDSKVAETKSPLTNLVNTNVKSEFLPDLIKAGLSNVVDWRSRWGWNWITKVKDQGGCESCWVFGAVGIVESIARIEHCVWSKRSEGDVHDGLGVSCAQTGGPATALDWMINHGVADPDCYPYKASDNIYTPTPDRNGRTVKIISYTTFPSDISKQKTWVDAVGPITLAFDVYHDFDIYWGAGANGVYRKTNIPNNNSRGSHIVTIVGYDDNQQCWICKNSWGMGGNKGYFMIGYGEANCDYYSKYGVQITNPDPWTKRRLHNGNIIESGNGALHRNFEIVATSNGTMAKHWWRDGSSFNWGAGAVFGNDVMVCPTLTATTFNRNFECVYMTTTKRLHHWWYDQANPQWKDGGVFGPADVWGVPGFIQGNYGAPGNFEVVVRTADGRLNHWWRDRSFAWHDGGRFGSGISLSGPTLVQSQYGAKGNLELVAVCAGTNQMQHYWRDNDHGNVWHAGVCFGANIFSPPVMIESQFGATDEDRVGNFELCVAVSGGAVQHWWRDNFGGTGWLCSTTFGSNVKTVAGLLQGSYGFNLEMIVITFNNQLQHYWRDRYSWHQGPIIGPA